jgi:hypothetical protein
VHVDQVAVQRLLAEAPCFAHREDPFDEPVAGVGLGAVARAAPQDGVAQRALGSVVSPA